MSTTVEAISSAAFTAANAAITDVIDDATITYVSQGSYNYTTGTYAVTSTSVTGRALFDTEKPASDSGVSSQGIFGDTIIGPQDQLVLLEGFSVEVKEGFQLTVNSINYEIKTAQKVVGSVSLQYAVVLKK
jgi:hypothetical protein|tara:strand:- start:499 stop:891 length:393 start_codon:yes stop_codon:yes gene_type:complete